jgi:hypothetical protein
MKISLLTLCLITATLTAADCAKGKDYCGWYLKQNPKVGNGGCMGNPNPKSSTI